MFRTTRRLSCAKGFNSRAQSTVSGPKSPLPQKKGGSSLPLVLLLAGASAWTFAAYKAETDSKFATSLEKIPYAVTLLNPTRSAVSAIMTMQKGEKSVNKDKLDAPAVKSAEVPKPKVEPTVVKADNGEKKAPDAKSEQQNVASVDEKKKETPFEKVEKAATAAKETVSTKATEAVETAKDKVQEVSKEVKKEVKQAAEAVEPKAVKVEVLPEPAPAPVVPVVVESTKAPTISAGITIPVMPSEELAKATDSKVLKQALADSARDYIALRRDLESTLLKDVHTLSEHDLRIRIKQLATEMFERLAWEDVRMTQSLKGVQSELSTKYADLMARQRQELEFEVKKLLFQYEQDATANSASKLREVESSYQKQLEDTIRAQAEGFHSTLKKELEEQSKKIHTELQDDLNHQVAVLRKDQVKELLELMPEIQSVTTQLGAVKLATDRTAAAIKQTIDIHQLSAAVLSLELALTSPTHYEQDDKFIAHHFAEVRKACQGDEVVKAALDALPPRVVSNGALQLPELQVRFSVMRDEVRKTTLTPEAAPKMIG